MSTKQNCRITKVEALTENISNFEIEILDEGFEKPQFECLEPGAHIDVYLDDGIIRQYSLWDWSEDKTKISIAVKREDQGDGGSLKMHQLEVGNLVGIDGPRNNFKLNPNASHYTLIAGGIGVTPIFAMAKELAANKAKVDVHYLVQKSDLAAFAKHFEALGFTEDNDSSYQLHCDDKDGMFDFKALMNKMPNESVIYTCGPEPMLNAVIDTVDNHSEKHELQFERFTIASEEAEKENTSISK